jgi:glutamate formiminotransferase/formiminotetrahydrofolate cyclodeaminase
VVELIRREAARYGVGIHHSELVGLIPEDALVDAAVWHLQLDQFEPEQILERRIRSALLESAAEEKKEDFLEALASEVPAPGGGSAAAYTGAEAAALVAMVARLTVGRKKYAAVDEQMRAILERAEALRLSLSSAVAEDAAAFQAVMAAFKLPKETPEEQQARQQAIEAATLNAAEVPLGVARQLVEVLELALPVVESGNLNAITDGGTGAELAMAALQGAAMNIRVNLKDYRDHPRSVEMMSFLGGLMKKAGRVIKRIRSTVAERGGLAPV